MPQLDFSTFSSQAFWMIVSFLLMWLLMAKMIVPKIVDIINQRQRKIDDYLSAANEFKQRAEAAIEKYEATLKLATDTAAHDARQLQAQLQKEVDRRLEESTDLLKKMQAENELKIIGNREEMMGQIENVACVLAVKIVEKLALDGISTEDIAQAAKREQNNG